MEQDLVQSFHSLDVLLEDDVSCEITDRQAFTPPDSGPRFQVLNLPWYPIPEEDTNLVTIHLLAYTTLSRLSCHHGSHPGYPDEAGR